MGDSFKAYQDFLQIDAAPDPEDEYNKLPVREDHGLHAILRHHFPVEHDFKSEGQKHSATIEYMGYTLEVPHESPASAAECSETKGTYASDLKLVIRLINWDFDATGKRSIVDIKEQEMYIGEIPLMTEQGTFVVDGKDISLLYPIEKISDCIDGAFAQITKTVRQRLAKNEDELECLMPHDLMRSKVLTNRLHRLLQAT